MCKIKDTIIEEQDTGVNIYGSKTYENGECTICGGRATHANNTLCTECWQDAEGTND